MKSVKMTKASGQEKTNALAQSIKKSDGASNTRSMPNVRAVAMPLTAPLIIPVVTALVSG
jgi:hypothetical protein